MVCLAQFCQGHPMSLCVASTPGCTAHAINRGVKLLHQPAASGCQSVAGMHVIMTCS